MKYKCFCHVDNYEDLSRDEVKIMIRGKKPFDPREFVNYYNIPEEKYLDFLLSKGLKRAYADRKFIKQWSDEKERKEQERMDKGEWDWTNVEEIPNRLIAALYDVPFEKRDNKVFYDSEELSKARQLLSSKLHAYNEKIEDRYQEPSNLKRADLIAMRYFRGYNRVKFSNLVEYPVSYIKQIEEVEKVVTKDIERLYIEALSIKKRHIVQLREIMTGKSDSITDDRAIPRFVKVKVWSRDKGKCVRCGSENKLHYHHKTRFSDGGRHEVDNLIILCAGCHAEEHKGEKAYHLLKKDGGG